MEQLLLDVIFKQVKNKKVTRSSKHGFTNVKLCLTSMLTFYDTMTAYLYEGKTVEMSYLDFVITLSHLASSGISLGSVAQMSA